MEDRGIIGGAHPFAKLVLLLILAFLGMFAILILGMLIAIPIFGSDITNIILRGEAIDMSANLDFSRYFQVLSHLGLFIIPSLVFAILVGRFPMVYLKGNRNPMWFSLLLSACIMVAALPLVNFLMEFNMQLHLPQWLGGVEEWMRRTEETAAEMTKMFLEVSSYQALLFNIFMIAVIPSIGEEFIFRGIVLRVIRQWSGSLHVAVWVSAILFSAMHMQFFGFLPRLLLGLVLGYLFVWSRNIWVPVFAHFFNNTAAVVLYFLHHNYIINFEIEEIGLGSLGLIWVAASLILITLLFVVFKNFESRQKERLRFD